MHGLLAFAALLAAQTPPGEVREGATDMPRARDGNIAIQQELEAARRAATVEAYDLFIARHPDHPLAKVARDERQCLIDRRKEDKR
jgi:hypothetical protein